MTALKNIFSLLRISHWSKSVFIFTGVIYARAFDYLGYALIATLAFCLVSSAVYIYNDIQDRLQDSLHPRKRHRLIAREAIPISRALFVLFVLLMSGLALSLFLSTALAAILGCYLWINLAYNHYLKHIVIFDGLCIASGFLLRVLAGTIGIGLPISWYLAITVTLLGLFVAFSKRKLELQLDLDQSTRKVLKKYNLKMLQVFMLISGLACFSSYFFYALYPQKESFFFILTLPFAAFALIRFSWLTSLSNQSDAPINVLMADKVSQFNLFCFIALTLMALS